MHWFPKDAEEWLTPTLTRRGRCNGAVSRETKMRPRSVCNAWFGNSLLRQQRLL